MNWAAGSRSRNSASPIVAKSDSSAAADQKEVAKALEKIYATVTLDPQQNITAVDFTDSDFTEAQIALHGKAARTMAYARAAERARS